MADLTKTYGSVRAVRGIDLVIAPGETVALFSGANGARKMDDHRHDPRAHPTGPTGSVSAFGLSPAAAVRAGRVGYLLQSGAPLDHLRVRALAALMASYYPHPLDVDEVLRRTGTEGLAPPPGPPSSPAGRPSGCASPWGIVGDPDLLVLDEPTAAIDVEGRREFWRLMRAIAERGTTILFATHYLEEADAFADRIVIMARGRIVADGPATEIKALGWPAHGQLRRDAARGRPGPLWGGCPAWPASIATGTR